MRLLSLDVALGAAAMSILFTHCISVDIYWINYLYLGLSVWLIYTLDHLMDVHKLGHIASTPRHRFHQKYFVPIFNGWLIIFMVVLSSALMVLSAKVITAGLTLSLLVAMHILLVKFFGHRLSFFIQKECVIALLYTAGVSFIPIALFQNTWQFHYSLTVINVFILALINLLTFSLFENRFDQNDSKTSFVRYFGPKKTKQTLAVLFAILFCIALFNICTLDLRYLSLQLILNCMGFSLLLIFLRKNYFESNERYRVLGDFIFMYPYVLLII
jgi:hypothetical protein